MNITKEQFTELVRGSVSKSEICRKLGIAANGSGLKKISDLAIQYNVDISHFSQQAAIDKHNRKYTVISKMCPVCGEEFATRENHRREQVTCSRRCSNVFFKDRRSKVESLKNHRTICFRFWKKECMLCGFDKVVVVHHMDYNSKNNHKDNLVPLCPNHHETLHTKEWNKVIVDEIHEKLRGVG